jgi:hypothetical protein
MGYVCKERKEQMDYPAKLYRKADNEELMLVKKGEIWGGKKVEREGLYVFAKSDPKHLVHFYPYETLIVCGNFSTHKRITVRLRPLYESDPRADDATCKTCLHRLRKKLTKCRECAYWEE